MGPAASRLTQKRSHANGGTENARNISTSFSVVRHQLPTNVMTQSVQNRAVAVYCASSLGRRKAFQNAAVSESPHFVNVAGMLMTSYR